MREPRERLSKFDNREGLSRRQRHRRNAAPAGRSPSGTDGVARTFARRNHGSVIVKKPAFAFLDSLASRFILTMGVVNLFADMTYEGGGSINGQFLGMLGAGAAAISIIAGLGEFL